MAIFSGKSQKLHTRVCDMLELHELFQHATQLRSFFEQKNLTFGSSSPVAKSWLRSWMSARHWRTNREEIWPFSHHTKVALRLLGGTVRKIFDYEFLTDRSRIMPLNHKTRSVSTSDQNQIRKKFETESENYSSIFAKKGKSVTYKP